MLNYKKYFILLSFFSIQAVSSQDPHLAYFSPFYKKPRGEESTITKYTTYYQLSRVPQIPVKVRFIDSPWGGSHIQHEFGRISEEHFNRLSKAYLPAPSLRYHPSVSYKLSDFFPAPIQVLSGKYMKDHTGPLSSLYKTLKVLTDGEVLTQGPVKDPGYINGNVNANCWGLAYEVARHNVASTPFLEMAYVGDYHMAQRLASPRYSKRVAMIRADMLSKPSFFWDDIENKLQPGDVMLLWGSRTNPKEQATFVRSLLHAAVFIDKELYFQKRGIDSKGQIHITTRFWVLNDYLFLKNSAGETARVDWLEWRRFGNGHEPLPPLSQGFGIDDPHEDPLTPDYQEGQNYFKSKGNQWIVSRNNQFGTHFFVNGVTPYLRVPLRMNSLKGTQTLEDPWWDSDGNLWGNRY